MIQDNSQFEKWTCNSDDLLLLYIVWNLPNCFIVVHMQIIDAFSVQASGDLGETIQIDRKKEREGSEFNVHDLFTIVPDTLLHRSISKEGCCAMSFLWILFPER